MLYNAAVDDGKEDNSDNGIILEAVDRWKACKDWQSTEDERAREDIKFANGDPRNNWQWPREIYDKRTPPGEELPCLTINNTRVHNDMIINAMSKNRYGIKIRPTGGKASYESAEVYQSLIRRIEYISKATTQYRKVAEHQVDGGIGYIVLSTAYISERSFDQEIYLKAARDPTAVYLDPWIKEPDGSDAGFGFEFEKLDRKVFNRKYKKWKNNIGSSPLAAGMEDWLSDDSIIVAKYWRKSGLKDTLIGYKDSNGEEIEKLASEIKDEAGKDLFKQLMKDIKNGVIDGQTREVVNDKVEWFLIAGNTIIDRGDWAGKYIPICRCPGRELVIEGKLDRKGHTRPLINAQHMLNFHASTAVQVGALQPKSPWIASSRAVEGQEQWKDANVKNYAVLIYNDVDDEAPEQLQRIDPPQRLDPPKPSPYNIQGMQDAERQMMMISGQFQAQMGENDTQSAASGKAIGERQQQGDTATYHFPEHQGDMLRFIGVQLLDLIPKIYDTKRTLHIMDEDGEKRWIQIDTDQTEALRELQDDREEEEAIKLAFNPAIGDYECISDPGPDYATQRQEAWQAMSMLMAQNQQMAGVCADLLFKFGDFPGADQIMERLQKEIKATKPYLFDEKQEPQMMALQQQLQRLTSLNAELVQKLALKDITLKGKSELRDIEASKAETDRLRAMVDALAKLTLTPQQRAQMEHELVVNRHDHDLEQISNANSADLDLQNQAAMSQMTPPQAGGQ